MVFKRDKMPSISAEELKNLLKENPGITLLDVRRQNEWQQTGVIPGSILISMHNLAAELKNGFAEKLKQKQPIVVICRSGNRSATVTNFLVGNMGVEALNLTGGIRAWYNIQGEIERI
ncbi:MAG: rhodanese-like domain-containing protein [Candidatus Kariarchaeaceae archaeon]|jgi:rhodanese-related sulfurtransferase